MLILYMLGCVCTFFAIEGSKTGEDLSKASKFFTILFWFSVFPIGAMIMILDHDRT